LTRFLFNLFLILIFLTLAIAQQRVSLQTSDYASDPLAGASFDFSPASASYICNQVCPQFYLNKDSKVNGYFTFSYLELIEINSTGGDCCRSGNCNPTATNCDFHHIFGFYNLFKTNITSAGKSVNFVTNLPNDPAAQSTCTQQDVTTGKYQLCVNLDITYEIIDAETTRQIADRTVTLKADSLWTALKISNWKFGQGSTGFRLIIDLATTAVDFSRFAMLPGGIADPPTATDLWDGMTAVDINGRQGSVQLQHFAVYSDSPNTSGNITITGPITSTKSVTGRQFSIFVPRRDTSNSVTLYLNLYLPYLTHESDIAAGGASSITLFYSIFCAVILYLL